MRLTLIERRQAMSDVNGHYEETLLLHPGWEIEPGFGLLQLRALEGTYDALQTEIETIEATGMPAKRAMCDALFGISSEDPDGVWILLGLYKSNARLALLRRASRLVAKSLGSTTPNIGVVLPGTYLAILDRFIEHWTLVNQSLPPAEPLILGTLTLAMLEAKRAEMAELIAGIDETAMTRLAVMRAKREVIFGDVREEEREPDSILAYMLAYETEIATQFVGTPLAATLPRIFPDNGGGEIKFPFNFKQVGSSVTVWFTMPDVTDAALVYLKEGAFEETAAIPTGTALKVVFAGVSVQGEVDDVELRDAAGKTVAFGKLDTSLIEPV